MKLYPNAIQTHEVDFSDACDHFYVCRTRIAPFEEASSENYDPTLKSTIGHLYAISLM